MRHVWCWEIGQIKRWISVNGPLMGVSSVPRCATTSFLCRSDARYDVAALFRILQLDLL